MGMGMDMGHGHGHGCGRVAARLRVGARETARCDAHVVVAYGKAARGHAREGTADLVRHVAKYLERQRFGVGGVENKVAEQQDQLGRRDGGGGVQERGVDKRPRRVAAELSERARRRQRAAIRDGAGLRCEARALLRDAGVVPR
eukprot:2833128-Prymnesium_polylepis.2